MNAIVGFAVMTASFDVLESIEEFLAEVPALGWALLVLALAVVIRTGMGAKAAARAGTVAVRDLETDGQETVKDLTGRLRQALADVGLRGPPHVPGGSPLAELSAAVESSPIPQAQWLASLIDLAERSRLLPVPAAYEITGALRTRPEGQGGICGVTVGLADTGRGDVSLHRTIWASDHRAAVDKAALVLYGEIVRQAPDVYPGWSRWNDPAALDRYLHGLRLEDERPSAPNLDPDADAAVDVEAERAYTQALVLEPRNLLPRLRRANLWEYSAAKSPTDTEAFALRVDAIAEYVSIVRSHPDVFEARYRSSALFHLLAATYETAAAQDRERLRTLTGIGGENTAVAARRLAREAVRGAGRLQLLLWGVGVPLRFLRLRHALEPKGQRRRRVRKATLVSQLCSTVRASSDRWITPLHLVLRWGYLFMRGNGVGWQAHYNAVCFYGIANERSASEKWRDCAVEHLRRVALHPDTNVDRRWLRYEDPDLDSLRGDARFSETCDLLFGPETA